MQMGTIKVIPLLPCVSFKDTVAFYEQLGFVNTYIGHKRSPGYAVMVHEFMEIQLYVYKKLEIPTPTNMTLIQSDHVDALYQSFKDAFKANTGKMPPRNGLPRIGIPKTLKHDRRFSLTDPNGNHFIFVQDIDKSVKRTENTRFEKLYWESHTLAYSHESPIEARKMLESALKRADLEKESPAFVFMVYVLLTDVCVLMEDIEAARMYYEQAKLWEKHINKQEREPQLLESLEQFRQFFGGQE